MAVPRTRTRTLRPRAHALPDRWADLDVQDALCALRERPGLVALDSAGGAPRDWSIVAFDPLLDFSSRASTHGAVPRSLAELESTVDGFELARNALDDEGLGRSPFAGGFIGALSYDLGVAGESLVLPDSPGGEPPIAGGIYGDWLLFEHGADAPRVTLFLSEEENGEENGTSAERVARLVADLDRLDGRENPDRGTNSTLATSEVIRDVSAEQHRARIERVRALIAEGEIYQANIAHRMHATTDADALDLYLRLRRVNPAPYMGFCRFATADRSLGAIVSASPELLLHIDANTPRVARTRPIKGTAPRGASPAEDEQFRRALMHSAKDRAELAMIVDLERNDLGRVAIPGGVRCSDFPLLETYASVHHLVADVTCELKPGLGPFDVLRSIFPGGSITGAPKLRSMEVIAELEEEGRGYFTGSLGFVDLRGAASMNILIRTLIHRESVRCGGGPATERSVSFHVGGGITWRSDAAAEDSETLHKAEGLLRVFSGS